MDDGLQAKSIGSRSENVQIVLINAYISRKLLVLSILNGLLFLATTAILLTLLSLDSLPSTPLEVALEGAMMVTEARSGLVFRIEAAGRLKGGYSYSNPEFKLTTRTLFGTLIPGKD